MKFIYLGAEPTLHAVLGLLTPGAAFDHLDQRSIDGLEAAGLALVSREDLGPDGLLLAEREAPVAVDLVGPQLESLQDLAEPETESLQDFVERSARAVAGARQRFIQAHQLEPREAPQADLESDVAAEDVAAETTTIPAGRSRRKKE